MLDVETQAAILSLHFGKKKSLRGIARELGINRGSVIAVVRRRKVLMGREGCGQRQSILDPHKGFMEEVLKKHPTIPASTLFYRIREKGYTGGSTIVREWVASQRPKFTPKREAFLTLEFQPGQVAQVDWGEFGNVFGDGVKIHCFVMVLCFSRMMYVEFTRGEKFEDFIRCHEHAFTYFGGVPEQTWYDNLTSAVSERRGGIIRFNRRFLAYLGHHGIDPHACNPARGNEKGRVEDGVKYTRSSFWAGRSFKDFSDLCLQSRDWNHETANKREHRATRKVPLLLFEAQEKKALRQMNPHPYDADEIFTRQVPPQYHIVYQTNLYSVPWMLVGQVITIRVSDEGMDMFYHHRCVAHHKRSYLQHQKFTNPKHEEGLLEIKPKGKNILSWQRQRLISMGPAMATYVDCLKASSRSLKSEITKLLALATVYGHETLNRMVEGFIKKGIIGADQIDLALKNTQTHTKPKPLVFKNETFSWVPPKVDLRTYDALLFEHNTEEENNGHEK